MLVGLSLSGVTVYAQEDVEQRLSELESKMETILQKLDIITQDTNTENGTSDESKSNVQDDSVYVVDRLMLIWMKENLQIFTFLSSTLSIYDNCQYSL